MIDTDTPCFELHVLTLVSSSKRTKTRAPNDDDPVARAFLLFHASVCTAALAQCVSSGRLAGGPSFAGTLRVPSKTLPNAPEVNMPASHVTVIVVTAPPKKSRSDLDQEYGLEA